MSDAPQPREPEPERRPEPPWRDPFYDGMENEGEVDEYPPPDHHRAGWPSPEQWWP